MAFADHNSAKLAGWFSRKYHTNEVHYRVSAANQDRLNSKRERAYARQAASSKLSLSEKLARLPKTGAKRERAKLTAKIAERAAQAKKPKTPVAKS